VSGEWWLSKKCLPLSTILTSINYHDNIFVKFRHVLYIINNERHDASVAQMRQRCGVGEMWDHMLQLSNGLVLETARDMTEEVKSFALYTSAFIYLH
jgi:hypothetical protein